jgi:hypothetical protein
LVVAILGEPTGLTDALTRSRQLWIVCAAMAVVSGLISAFQPPIPQRAAAPVLAEAAA